MPRDSAGTFTRTNGTFTGSTTWAQQAASADKTISSARHDTHDQDVADGMTDSLSRSGKGGMQANLDLTNFRALNVAAATVGTDAPNARQAQDGLDLLGNVAGADAVTAEANPPLTGGYTTGARYRLTVAATNTAAVTLDINGQGVSGVKLPSGDDLPVGAWTAGARVEVERTATEFEYVPPSVPSGTRIWVHQATAPIGYTRDTDPALHDIGLRINTTGTPADGGSLAFSTVFGRTATDDHTLSTSAMPSHDHRETIGTSGGGGLTWSNSPATSTILGTTTSSFDTLNTGGGGAHSHAIDLRLKYADGMIVVKD